SNRVPAAPQRHAQHQEHEKEDRGGFEERSHPNPVRMRGMIAQSRRGAPPSAVAPGAGPRAAAAFLACAALFAGCGRAPVTPPSKRPLFVSDRGGAARLYEADDEAGS